MSNGWVKIHRKLLENPLAKKPAWAWLWVVLLLLASHEERESFTWKGKKILLKRGQFVTGRKKLKSITGIPESSIERTLNYLEIGHQIEQQKTTKYRLISIVNWDSYQQTDIKTDNKMTKNGHNQEELIQENTNTYRDSSEPEKTMKSGPEQNPLFTVEPEPVVTPPASAPPKNKREAYLKMVTWAEERRGFKFMNYPKQFKALSEAVRHGIPPGKVYERWEKFEKDKFWIEKGFDFMDVVVSFGKKQ